LAEPQRQAAQRARIQRVLQKGQGHQRRQPGRQLAARGQGGQAEDDEAGVAGVVQQAAQRAGRAVAPRQPAIQQIAGYAEPKQRQRHGGGAPQQCIGQQRGGQQAQSRQHICPRSPAAAHRRAA